MRNILLNRPAAGTLENAFVFQSHPLCRERFPLWVFRNVGRFSESFLFGTFGSACRSAHLVCFRIQERKMTETIMLVAASSLQEISDGIPLSVYPLIFLYDRPRMTYRFEFQGIRCILRASAGASRLQKAYGVLRMMRVISGMIWRKHARFLGNGLNGEQAACAHWVCCKKP